jgi:hypothetical protein
MRIQGVFILSIALSCMPTVEAQDNTFFTDKLINLPSRFNERILKNTEKPTRQTGKYLQQRALKEEQRHSHLLQVGAGGSMNELMIMP